jgi:RNA recognition motif-containing protein
MTTKLYVGNLPYNVTEQQLRALFAEAGEVGEVALIMDQYTGRSKGFAFVEMATDADAQAAINKFNGYELETRNLVVDVARPREQRQGSGGGRNERRGGGRRRY